MMDKVVIRVRWVKTENPLPMGRRRLRISVVHEETDLVLVSYVKDISEEDLIQFSGLFGDELGNIYAKTKDTPYPYVEKEII